MRSMTEGADGDASRRFRSRVAQCQAAAQGNDAAGNRPVARASPERDGPAISQAAFGSDYVLDFYCAPAMLAIEVDGEAHARGDRPARDAVRDAWLASQGVRVLRYPAKEVLTNLEGVVRQIIAVAIRRRDRIES